MKFRDLRADEVECRVGSCKEGVGISLLLYKDARCDMNILDETVGEMNWQRAHVLIDGQLFCRVGIREEHENYSTGFTWKEDVGTESNTEQEKSRASDAFKRACVNWGIGRELYTAPFIWIYNANKKDKFWVREMEVEDKKIVKLRICARDKNGEKTDVTAFEWKLGEKPKRGTAKTKKAEEDPKQDDPKDEPISENAWSTLKERLKELKITQTSFLAHYGIQKPSQITLATYRNMLIALKRTEEQRNEQQS